MKKILVSLLVLLSVNVYAQETPKQGSTEQKLNTALCECMNKLDITKASTRELAINMFNGCFIKQPKLIFKLAEERKIDPNNQEAMTALGFEVGRTLVSSGCENAVQLGKKMSGG